MENQKQKNMKINGSWMYIGGGISTNVMVLGSSNELWHRVPQIELMRPLY